jgi:hypothetical protein
VVVGGEGEKGEWVVEEDERVEENGEDDFTEKKQLSYLLFIYIIRNFFSPHHHYISN